MQRTYEVNGKIYTKEQLIALGRQKYPKLYWIPRVLGIIFLLIGLLVCALMGGIMLILNAVGVFDDPTFPKWVFAIPFGLFGGIAIGGIICIVVSCLGRSNQTYLDHALAYLTKVEVSSVNDENGHVERVLSEREVETLARNKRLLDGGVISQEEYERRNKEVLGD